MKITEKIMKDSKEKADALKASMQLQTSTDALSLSV